MTERRKKLLRWIGYPLLATLTFLFTAHFTFPYERVRDRIVDALASEMDVTIGDIGPGWLPGQVHREGVTLTTRPKREDEKPKARFSR